MALQTFIFAYCVMRVRAGNRRDPASMCTWIYGSRLPPTWLNSWGVCHLWHRNKKGVALPVSGLGVLPISFYHLLLKSALPFHGIWELGDIFEHFRNSFEVGILELSSILSPRWLIIRPPSPISSTAFPNCFSPSVLIFKAPGGFPSLPQPLILVSSSSRAASEPFMAPQCLPCSFHLHSGPEGWGVGSGEKV